MKRALLFVGAAVLVTIIIVAVAARRPSSDTNQNQNVNSATTITNTVPEPIRDESPEGLDRAEAQTTARIVVERLGSYSTDTLPTIAIELASFLTDAGRRDVDGFLALERQRLGQAAAAVSVTTSAFAVTVQQHRLNATATASGQTRRVEQVGQSESTTTLRSVSVGLSKRDGRWLVDDVTWQ